MIKYNGWVILIETSCHSGRVEYCGNINYNYIGHLMPQTEIAVTAYKRSRESVVSECKKYIDIIIARELQLN